MPIEFRCSQCGKLLRTGDDTAGRQAQCPECGALTGIPGAPETTPIATPRLAPLDSGARFAPGPPAGANSKAVTALVLGLAGLGFWCCPLVGFPITIVGIILGIMSLRSESKGFAVAGIVLSSVGLVLTVLNAILGVVMMLTR